MKFTSGDGSVVFEIIASKSLSARLKNTQYRGSIEIIKTRTDSGNLNNYWIVNEALVDDYLRGVEYGDVAAYQDLLKIVSILNRSYVIYYAKRGGRYKNMPFDIKRDEGQIFYTGYGAEETDYKKLMAVEDTRGHVLTYNNDVALALYSSDTCGVSQNAEIVLGSFYGQFPYLDGGISDPPETRHLESCSYTKNGGVGLSLEGAKKMLADGENYQNVLRYYYPFTVVQKFY
jgi:peptidoglycan hydrolase-like amidase